MKVLGVVVAAFGAATIAIAWFSGHSILYLMAAFSLLAAYTTFRSAGISTFLQVLISLFSVETILLGLCVLVSGSGYWPKNMELVRIPSTVVMTVALFSVVCYLTSYIPVARKTLAIADRYFRAEDIVAIPLGFGRSWQVREGRLAGGAIMFIVVLNQVEVWLTVLMTYANSAISDALQGYDQPGFWYALLVSFPLSLTPYLVALFIEFLAANTLSIRWRRWLTADYSRRWLDHHNHYRMMLAGIGTDNPDQRIQEDIPRFIDGGQFGSLGIYNFSINLIAQLSSLVSYSIILWAVSDRVVVPGTQLHIPGFLLWFAIVYAIVGTVATGIIGRPLAQLAFARQHYEANFRFGLARLREYSEQIALLFGEAAEKSILLQRFMSVVRNYYSIMYVKAFLSTFIQFFQNISQFIPYILLGALYFTRKVSLGDLTKVSIAFGQVNSSLTFFVNYYSNLADFKSVLDRLTTFDASLEAAPPPPALSHVAGPARGEIILRDMTIRLPDGTPLSEKVNLQLAANENVLMSGPSGVGKSTLFRVMSGVWPYRDGVVDIPVGASIMVLPQKPYLPIGSLAAALSYPHDVGTYDVEAIQSALVDVALGQLTEKLDVDDNWSQRLSGGEQQRLAIARALLARPDWLLLDEATAAMDVDLESRIYKRLAERLPNTTIISIAHRETLADHHGRVVTFQKDPDGRFTLDAVTIAAE
jgi:putative ATP-binding cassette transporter